jgi:hypothetical protein
MRPRRNRLGISLRRFSVPLLPKPHGQEQVHEITSLQRTELKPETLGLSLAEGKAILREIQRIVVEQQTAHCVAAHRLCSDCGQPRHSKGHHDLPMRTVFGKITIQSPRYLHCDCRPHQTKSFSPLAQALPERTTPELLFLETKWSALMSYGLTAELLQEVLPMDSPLHASTIREHVFDVAQRLENELGEEQWSFIEGCQRDWNKLPQPDGPLTVGNGERIASGFVESAVNQVVSKRMVKRQQMEWTPRGAHLLLQVRTRVFNEEWEDTFRRWYPGFRSQTQEQSVKKAA